MTKRLPLAALRAALMLGGTLCAALLFPVAATAQVFADGDDTGCLQQMEASGRLFCNDRGQAGMIPNFAGQESSLERAAAERWLVSASAVAEALAAVPPAAPAGVYLGTVSGGARIRTTRWSCEPSCTGATTTYHLTIY